MKISTITVIVILAAAAGAGVSHLLADAVPHRNTAAGHTDHAEKQERTPRDHVEQDEHGADRIRISDVKLAAAGVKLLGEVGLGGVKDGPTARKMVGWARKYGIQSTIHTGGPSIPGSGLIDKDVVLEAGTDVIGHINGGHTALPDDQIRCICEGCKAGLELVHNGNERSALFTLRTAREMNDLHRVILGTDAPAGSGVQPLGILRMVSLLSSLGDVPAEIAFCFATGNTARMRELDCGLIEVGRSADFVIMDKAQHSPAKTLLDSVQLGDLPGIGMTIIDGIVRTQRSRNTPPATKIPEIVAK